MPRAPKGQSRERVFAFVQGRLLQGEPPTVREVQRAMGFSAVQTAREHLEALVKDGRLEKEAGRSRGYRLARRRGRDLQAVPVPLLGHVQAGVLTTAIEDPEGWLAVQSHLSAEDLFALRVRGESMRDAGILPGDVVVVRRQATASSGDIVVALVGDEATVKRLRVSPGRVELLPENPSFSPLVFEEGADVDILGRVVEVRRFLEVMPFLPET